MRGQMQQIIKAKPLQKSLWDLLRKVQVCASGDIWQLWFMPVLRRLDHPGRRAQVPLGWWLARWWGYWNWFVGLNEETYDLCGGCVHYVKALYVKF